MEIPEIIKCFIKKKSGNLVNIGMPDSKLPVPKIIEQENANKLSYILMTKCSGNIACHETLMADSKLLTQTLAEVLVQIWSMDIKDYPSNCLLQYKIPLASRDLKILKRCLIG